VAFITFRNNSTPFHLYPARRLRTLTPFIPRNPRSAYLNVLTWFSYHGLMRCHSTPTLSPLIHSGLYIASAFATHDGAAGILIPFTFCTGSVGLVLNAKLSNLWMAFVAPNRIIHCAFGRYVMPYSMPSCVV